MDARLLTRGTNLLLVSVLGLTSGHLLMPVRPTASALARGAFVATVGLSGAIAGWREHAITSEYRGHMSARGSGVLWAGAGAGAALVLAALAWYIVHG